MEMLSALSRGGVFIQSSTLFRSSQDGEFWSGFAYFVLYKRKKKTHKTLQQLHLCGFGTCVPPKVRYRGMQEKNTWVIYHFCESSEDASGVCCLVLGQEPARSLFSLKLESNSGSYCLWLEPRQRSSAVAPWPVQEILPLVHRPDTKVCICSERTAAFYFLCRVLLRWEFQEILFSSEQSELASLLGLIFTCKFSRNFFFPQSFWRGWFLLQKCFPNVVQDCKRLWYPCEG